MSEARIHKIISLLCSEFEKGREHHAYLFSGNSVLAKHAAQEALKRIASYEIYMCCADDGADKQTSISIANIRSMLHSLTLTTAEGQYQVMWIDPADALTQEASNALLKALEEPPHRTVFFLFSKNVRSVLSTVRSRCHIYRFAQTLQNSREKVNDRSPAESAVNATVFETLLGGTGSSSDDFISYEYDVRKRIQGEKNAQQYTQAVRSYQGMREALMAKKNHVGNQACVDLLHL